MPFLHFHRIKDMVSSFCFHIFVYCNYGVFCSSTFFSSNNGVFWSFNKKRMEMLSTFQEYEGNYVHLQPSMKLNRIWHEFVVFYSIIYWAWKVERETERNQVMFWYYERLINHSYLFDSFSALRFYNFLREQN